LQLAYPGEDSNSTKRYGIDAFITAVNDPALEFEVMKQAPSSLQEAANCATKLEAYTEMLSDRTTVTVERGSGKTQVLSRSCSIFRTTVEPEGSANTEATLLERIGQLEKQLEQVAKGNRDARGSSSRKAGSKKNGKTGRGKPVSEKGERVCPSPETHPCTYCKELGHWRRDCPKSKARGQESEEANVRSVLAVSANMSPTKIYVTAEVNGEPVRCLLNSGCERSVISADLVPNVELTPSQYTLYAANKASLGVVGDSVIPFVIDGHNFEADVSVSEKVDEFLLGSGWLEKYGTKWDFADGTVTLGDHCIKVHCRHRAGICRRIVVAHDCVIPTKHEATVTIRMEDDGIPLPPSDWAVEPQNLGPGVMAARTLFSDSQSQLVARVLNNSLQPMSLRANSFLSTAELVQCISGSSSADLSDVLLAGSSNSVDSVTPDESDMLVSASLRSSPTQTVETGLHASTVSSTTTADRMDSDSSASLSENAHRRTIISTVCCIVFLRT